MSLPLSIYFQFQNCPSVHDGEHLTCKSLVKFEEALGFPNVSVYFLFSDPSAQVYRLWLNKNFACNVNDR
uniref:Uncharacterized protein n=1 Tax=Anguilla anguilla TaxID=7936 RepID=A0A0E9PKR1_ANGAN